jgi:1,4-dihydroxy-6-naphthoate synthase
MDCESLQPTNSAAGNQRETVSGADFFPYHVHDCSLTFITRQLMTERTIRVGHSPDPDDAFMFYGLASGKVKLPGIRIEHMLEDIQSLNERALRAELEVTAISAHAFPYVADKYWIMKTGASMGEGYGPVIISRKYRTLGELRGRTVGTPGPLTTATLLFKTFTDGIRNVDMPFDKIMDAVDQGTVDAGLLIHEGQITYQSLGYHKVLDFGEFWEKETQGLPLPLGLDVVRKDLGEELARTLSQGLKESIAFGYAHQNDSIPYAMQWGRGIDFALGEKFVKMYVSELTIEMGEKGKKALELLFAKGAEKGFIPKIPALDLY